MLMFIFHSKVELEKGKINQCSCLLACSIAAASEKGSNFNKANFQTEIFQHTSNSNVMQCNGKKGTNIDSFREEKREMENIN